MDFAEIDEKTLCLSTQTIDKAITDRTKAIVPVHFTGVDIQGNGRVGVKLARRAISHIPSPPTDDASVRQGNRNAPEDKAQLRVITPGDAPR